jgi:hypothetical protein
MSLKTTNLTKSSKQPQPHEKAFGNYTKLSQKAFVKPTSQLSAHKRTRSDIPQFNNFLKQSPSPFQIAKQSAQKRSQQSTSKYILLTFDINVLLGAQSLLEKA